MHRLIRLDVAHMLTVQQEASLRPTPDVICSLLPILLLTACGGGGGPAAAPQPQAPDIVLFVISGHDPLGGGLLDGNPSSSYLHLDAGPEIKGDLESAGLTVVAKYYVDDAYAVGGFGGYHDLEYDMERAAQEWVPYGTRAIVMAHSHGGVWAHGAVRSTPALNVYAQIDLDCTSYGWGALLHTDQNADLGGEPRDAYTILGTRFDLEDVVFENVTYNLGVCSGEVIFTEYYDELWNYRLNGSRMGCDNYFSSTSHEEVHEAGGVTLAYVRSWLRARLGL